jgi:hypothetical protein
MEKIIRIINMHHHHKKYNNQYNNQNNKIQVIRPKTESYNHVINDLQDYMLYGKLLVQSLKTRSKINNQKHKIMTTNEDSIEKEKEKNKLMKKEKERFFYPSQKDQLYWCFFIMKNGFTAYEYPDVSSFVNEKNDKIKCVTMLRENKQQLKGKKIKNIKEHVENELVNCSTITMKTFIALCVAANINVLYIQKRKCFEMIFDEDSPIHVVHDMLNDKYCYEPDASKEQIEHYRKTMFKWESIEKPLKAVGSYTSDELIELSKQLGLETMKIGENKKKTKNELYEQIVLNI